MKILSRVLTFVLFVLVFAVPSFAQFTSGPSQYSFIQNNVGLNSTNTISDGPGPMQITFDVFSNGTLGQVLTSSACSNSGQPNSQTHTVKSGSIDVYTFVMDSGTIILTEQSGSSPLYNVSGTCPLPPSNARTYTLNSWAALEQGSYWGFGFFFGPAYDVTFQNETYNGSNGTLGEANIGIITNNDGTLSGSGYITSFRGAHNSCFQGQTFSTTTLAKSFDANFVSGDTAEVTVDDGNGNVVTFIISATDANGNTSTIKWPSQAYFTYIVDAGACVNQQGTDAPGRAVTSELAPPPGPHSPIRRMSMSSPVMRSSRPADTTDNTPSLERR